MPPRRENFPLFKILFTQRDGLEKKDNIERDKEERNEPSKSQCETKNGSACRYFDLVCPKKGKKTKEMAVHKQQTHRGNNRKKLAPGGRTGAAFLIFEPRKGTNSW